MLSMDSLACLLRQCRLDLTPMVIVRAELHEGKEKARRHRLYELRLWTQGGSDRAIGEIGWSGEEQGQILRENAARYLLQIENPRGYKILESRHGHGSDGDDPHAK